MDLLAQVAQGEVFEVLSSSPHHSPLNPWDPASSATSSPVWQKMRIVVSSALALFVAALEVDLLLQLARCLPMDPRDPADHLQLRALLHADLRDGASEDALW